MLVTGILRLRLKLMTSSDHKNDLVPSQEKLEWVTPKISLMEAEKTEGGKATFTDERITFSGGGGSLAIGPS